MQDKSTPTAIEYWFRIMDLDGDGVLSMYELEEFYSQQVRCRKMRFWGLKLNFALAYPQHVFCLVSSAGPPRTNEY